MHYKFQNTQDPPNVFIFTTSPLYLELSIFQVVKVRTYRNDAKIAKNRNLWTFWPVIRPINHLLKI